MAINLIKRNNAVAFIKSHDGVARVEDTPHEIVVWGEAVGPGGEFVERHEFMPDIYGLFDLNDIRSYLGY